MKRVHAPGPTAVTLTDTLSRFCKKDIVYLATLPDV